MQQLPALQCSSSAPTQVTVSPCSVKLKQSTINPARTASVAQTRLYTQWQCAIVSKGLCKCSQPTVYHPINCRAYHGVQLRSGSCCPAYAGLISCFSVSAAGRYVTSGSAAGALKLWSSSEGVQLDVQQAAHPAGVSALAFLEPGVVSLHFWEEGGEEWWGWQGPGCVL